MFRLEIELLGEARFRFDGKPWRFVAPPKCLPLLALLPVEEHPQQRSALASALWPEESDREARANLRRHLHALTRALPKIDGLSWIEATATSVSWNADAPARCDLRDFLNHASNPATWVAATQLYRGDVLGTSFDEALVATRERFASAHVGLLAELASAARTDRNYQDAIGYAEAILAIDEWREDMVRLLILVRNAAGDRSGALATFERFARRLHDELHTEPMFETLAVRDAILAGTLPAESETPLRAATSARTLVGRTTDIASLQAHWLRAARGSGSTTFISGEAGIGKTRLAHELQTIVEAQGGRAIVGRTSKPESIPYQPIIEALRQAIPFVKRDPRDDRWLAALLPFIPEIRRIGDTLPDLAHLEPSRARLRLHDAFARALEACARVRPLAVIIEDAHCAQPDTVDAIGSLAETIPSAPILLLVTYRSTEATADSPIRSLRRRLARASLANHLSLGRLGSDEVRAMVVASDASIDDAFVADVYARSEGNPLFVWQLIHDRIERGERSHAEAHTVGDAIRSRLKNVDPDVRVVAEVAATIGDTFTVEEIAEVGGWDESLVFAALARLLDRQLVAERAGTAFEYGFTHALIGSAIYDATSRDARRIRHRRAADVLARTRTDRGGVLPLVAQHWLQAQERERACAAFIEAARAALESYARYDALASARRALELDPTPAQRFEALRIVIKATEKFVDIDGAERALEEFEGLAERLGRRAQYDALVTRIRFHENHAQRAIQEEIAERLTPFVRPDDPNEWKVEALLRRVSVRMQRGMTAAGEAELGTFDYSTIVLQRQRHQFHSMLAQSLFRQGKYDAGRESLALLRAYLDEHPNLDGEWQYAYAAHKEAWLTGDSPDVMRSAQRLIDLAQQRGDVADEAAGLMDLATMKHQLHDTASARTTYQRALEIWARARQWQGWANTIINLGEAEREIGHLDRALSYWEQGKARGIEAGARFAPIIADLGIADVEVLRGNVPAALARLRPLQGLLAGTGERRTIAEVDTHLGRALCAHGNFDEGLPLIKGGIELLRSMVQGRWRATYLAYYIDAMIASGETNDLPNAVAELSSIFDDDPHDQVSPGGMCVALAAAARYTGDAAAESAWIERGREAVQARLDALADEEVGTAYAALPPNAGILAQDVPLGLSH